MGDERPDCNMCPNGIYIGQLQDRMEKAEQELADMKYRVTVGEEQTKKIFDLLDRIEKSIERIAVKVEKLERRPDTFKDQVYAFGLKIAEWALVGGMLYMAMQGKTP